MAPFTFTRTTYLEEDAGDNSDRIEQYNHELYQCPEDLWRRGQMLTQMGKSAYILKLCNTRRARR